MARKLIIRDNNNEIVYPETLSNLVYDDVTGRTVKDDLANHQGGGGETLLELSTTDGTLNKTTLNQALALGDVKLKKGHYPIDPGVVVNGVTLDLNGACLQSTKEKISSALITVRGEKPILKNGEVCCNYNTADNEEGYEFFETEKIIGCKLYTDALLENLDLHNCWGTAIVYGGINWETEGVRKSIHTATAITTVSDGRSTETTEYLTDPIDIPEGYQYTGVYGGLGYTRILSQRSVVYTFYNSAGTKLKSSTAMPNTTVLIPSGAATVTVRTYSFDDFKETWIGFINSKCNCLTVKDCRIHNNHSLGMLGMQFGTTKVINCRSYEHGKPRSTAPASSRSTTGFMDIEDICTPILIMSGCTSSGENKLIMSGAYRTTITDCYGSIGIYRGWSANISNCVGKIWTISEDLLTLINVSNCVFYDSNSTSVHWTGSNNTFIGCRPDNLTREHNFIIRRLITTSPAMSLTGVIVGKITNPVGHSNKGITSVATAKGSQFVFDWTLDGNGNSASYGTYNVDGDCYGITATCPFLPNGYTIYDSTFNLHHSYGQSNVTNNAWTGEYNNCVFNLSFETGTDSNGNTTYEQGSMFYNTNQYFNLDTKNTLIFRNCKINNSIKTLFNGLPANAASKGYTIKFINCKIADQNKLFATTPPTGVIVEIITEDTDYDSRIKALEERIRQLEEGN